MKCLEKPLLWFIPSVTWCLSSWLYIALQKTHLRLPDKDKEQNISRSNTGQEKQVTRITSYNKSNPLKRGKYEIA